MYMDVAPVIINFFPFSLPLRVQCYHNTYLMNLINSYFFIGYTNPEFRILSASIQLPYICSAQNYIRW